MLQHAATINQTVKGLGALVDNQHSLISFLINNWPVTALAGAALAALLRRRIAKKELDFLNVFQDFGTVIIPVSTLFMLQRLAKDAEAEKQATQQILSRIPVPTGSQAMTPVM
jgi:hypothetical protein